MDTLFYVDTVRLLNLVGQPILLPTLVQFLEINTSTHSIGTVVFSTEFIGTSVSHNIIK